MKDCKARPEMINQLSEYLKYRPEWEEPRDLLLVDELEQRLDLAEKFQTWKRTKLTEKAKKANPDDDEAHKQAMGWNLNRLAYAATTNRSVEIEPKDSNLTLCFC
jgi:DNA topoisomerase IB